MGYNGTTMESRPHLASFVLQLSLHFFVILRFCCPELLPTPTDVTNKPPRYWTYPPTSKTTPTTTTTTTTTTTATTTSTMATTTTAMTPRPPPKKCQDIDMNCFTWVAENADSCEQDTEVLRLCRRSCQMCGQNYTVEVPDNAVEEMYDMRRVPPHLHRLAFLIGRWQSDFGGKADFPTIPRFTYGEKLDFSLGTHHKQSVLNYSAFAWDNSDLTELHSEHGFLLGWQNSSEVALNTVMSNGFVTIEKGQERDHSIRFELDRIGRINFSRDLPVRRMIREWILLNATHMEARLHMATVHPNCGKSPRCATYHMLLHTHIVYKRVYPL